MIGLMLAAAVAGGSSALRARPAGPVKSMATPPFEIQASSRALSSLAEGLGGYHCEAWAGRYTAIWLRAANGRVLCVSVDQRDIRPLFEVFALSVLDLDELHALWLGWEPHKLPPEVPESFRQLTQMRPPEPAAPAEFTPWPFRASRISVLRRSEFVVEAPEATDTFGKNANFQSASRPADLPDGVQTSCDVDVGLLFGADDGRRLLIGVDWSPMKLVFLREDTEIDAYLEICELTPLQDYIARRWPDA